VQSRKLQRVRAGLWEERKVSTSEERRRIYVSTHLLLAPPLNARTSFPAGFGGVGSFLRRSGFLPSKTSIPSALTVLAGSIALWNLEAKARWKQSLGKRKERLAEGGKKRECEHRTHLHQAVTRTAMVAGALQRTQTVGAGRGAAFEKGRSARREKERERGCAPATGEGSSSGPAPPHPPDPLACIV
jgi:hypothetical protein